MLNRTEMIMPIPAENPCTARSCLTNTIDQVKQSDKIQKGPVRGFPRSELGNSKREKKTSSFIK